TMAPAKCYTGLLSKASVQLHMTVLAIILTSFIANANRLRLTRDKVKLAHYTRDYKKHLASLTADGPSIKRKRHLGSMNTPSVKMKAYLFCKTGFLLQIDNYGRITGTTNVSSTNAILEIHIFDKILRRVKGARSGRYLSINNRGRLTATFSRNKNTFFKENDEENAWYSYSSKNHGQQCGLDIAKHSRKEWFIAIKENGYLRRPCKTLPGMKATHFFVIRLEKIKDILKNTPEFH
ncbi:fibroblast growth factor, partial [Salmonella sp. s51933]|uniref:fibroblast growth factor n=1 Tax=Salmonella sp. s51933 TaxID=3160127 RepID=UPI0037543B7A